jgi:hypothetical protein
LVDLRVFIKMDLLDCFWVPDPQAQPLKKTGLDPVFFNGRQYVMRTVSAARGRFVG